MPAAGRPSKVVRGALAVAGGLIAGATGGFLAGLLRGPRPQPQASDAVRADRSGAS